MSDHPEDDQFTDAELRDLLHRLVALIHGNPPTAATAERIEVALQARGRRRASQEL